MKVQFRPIYSNFSNNIVASNSGTIMIFVLILSVIASIMISSFFLTSRYTLKSSGNHRVKVDVLNIAEAGKEKALAALRSRTFDPIANKDSLLYSNESFSSGTYFVHCETNATNDTVIITSTGTIGASSVKIKVIARMEPDAWRKWIKGAVTARTGVDFKGNFEVDGRDYDTIGGDGGTLINPVGGTYGVSSGGTVTAGGSSTIGGHTVAPLKSPIPGVTVEENIDITGYPTTPEEVLGVPAGSLDKYKITSCPPSDFFGIVYVEDSKNLCKLGGGILICHNSSGTATIGNYHDNFKGLIITDEDKHINSKSVILGAVIFLGTNVGGNCAGNGSAKVHYSSKMLNKAVSALSAGGRRTVTVLSWSEII